MAYVKRGTQDSRIMMSMTCGKLIYIYVGVLPTYNTIVWSQMATYVMNLYSRTEVLSVMSTNTKLSNILDERSWRGSFKEGDQSV